MALPAAAFAAVALLASGFASDAVAQRDPRRERQQQRIQEPPRQQERGGGFFRIPLFDRLFGGPSRRWEEPQQQGRPPAARRPQQPAASGPPPRPKVDPKYFVAVIGDGMAEAVASGLEEALYDRPEIAITRKIHPDLGLLDEEPGWAQTVRDFLPTTKIDVAVIALGHMDQYPLAEGNTAHAFRSARWNHLYAARADEVLIAMAERRLPIVWLGLPPVEIDSEAAGNAHINEILRQRVIGLGGVFLDVWEGFVDDEGQYDAVGHALDGRSVRLRLNDGVGFSRAGARKYAHYAEIEIRRLFPPEGEREDVAANLISGGDASVHVLTAPPRTPGATLLSAEMPALRRSSGEPNGDIPPGRADDFRWQADDGIAP